VQFQDSSEGHVTTWFWDFGDSTTSTLRHPSHNYAIPGLYGVKLSVSGPGGEDTIIKPGLVLVAWPTGVKESGGTPVAFRLMPNYPNPFNDRTTLIYQIPDPAEIALSVYDIGGQHIATIAEGHRDAGEYAVTWDGRDDRGYPVASGVYIVQLNGGPSSQSQKVLYLK
jgi:PKD repeat protein